MLSGNINGIRRAAAWMLAGVMVCGFIGCGQKEDTDGKNEGTPEAQVTKGAESDVQVTQGAEPEQIQHRQNQPKKSGRIFTYLR